MQSQAQVADWSVKKYIDNSFEINSPQPLQCGIKTYTNDSTGFSNVIHNCVYQEDYTKDGRQYKGKIFMVTIMEYPNEPLYTDSIALILELMQESIPTRIGNYKTNIIYQSENNYLSAPGVSYRLNYNEGKSTLKARMIWYKNKLFTVQCFSSVERALDTGIDKFIESFRILE